MSFILSEELGKGKKFEAKHSSHNGKYLRVLVHRMPEDERDETVIEKLKQGPDPIVEKEVNVTNMSTGNRYKALDVYALAVNEQYVDYPELAEYLEGGFATNCDYTHKMEILLQYGDLKKRLFLDWNGNRSFFEYARDIDSELEDEISSGKLDKQGLRFDDEYDVYLVWMYSDTGEFVEIEMQGSELVDSIVSMRVVAYTEEIAK
jgi:hypothetical protein